MGQKVCTVQPFVQAVRLTLLPLHGVFLAVHTHSIKQPFRGITRSIVSSFERIFIQILRADAVWEHPAEHREQLLCGVFVQAARRRLHVIKSDSFMWKTSQNKMTTVGVLCAVITDLIKPRAQHLTCSESQKKHITSQLHTAHKLI